MNSTDDFVSAIDEKDLSDGKMKLKSIEGIPILFLKQSGQVYAIDNRCPHQGCGLSGGTLEGAVVICPCHDWRFSLKTGEYEEEPSMKLIKFDYKIEAGKIYVKLPDE